VSAPAGVLPGTEPSVDWLWRLLCAVDRELVRSLGLSPRWRIARSDWDLIRRWHRKAVPGPTQPGDPERLFGVPVDVVPDEAGRWPELVIACDRRD